MRSVKRSRSVVSDEGSILLEASGFATLAFGLLLTLSLQVFELENRQLGLEQIARNATRSYLLHPGADLVTSVRDFQELDQSFATKPVEIFSRCLPADCFASGTLVWLELKSGENTARAYGVIP